MSVLHPRSVTDTLSVTDTNLGLRETWIKFQINLKKVKELEVQLTEQRRHHDDDAALNLRG